MQKKKRETYKKYAKEDVAKRNGQINEILFLRYFFCAAFLCASFCFSATHVKMQIKLPRRRRSMCVCECDKRSLQHGAAVLYAK